MTDKVHAGGLTAEGSYNPTDKLLAGEGDFQHEKGVLITGQNLKRGALAGRITASSKLTVYAAGASDGSEVAYGIIMHDVDATAADVEAMIYVGGVFSEQEVIAQTAGLASITDALRSECRHIGITLRDVTV